MRGSSGPSVRRFSPRFFLAVDPSLGEGLVLDAEDSHHGIKVLRLKVGDRCEVVGLEGHVYQAVVSSASRTLELTVTAPISADVAGPVYRFEVGLVQALARPAVMDYVLEKGTEVGADFFVLVQSAGSPGRVEGVGRDRLDRWRRVAREAAKQSKQTRIPEVSVSLSVSQTLHSMKAAGRTNVVLDPGAVRSLDEVAAAESAAGSTRLCLWIGSEGGWDSVEWDHFRAAGAGSARLGRSVLRTETAGPVAVAIARLALQDW